MDAPMYYVIMAALYATTAIGGVWVFFWLHGMAHELGWFVAM